MTLRIEPITRLPLMQAGSACPTDKLSELEARLLSDLHDDVPILKYLRGSSVITHYEVNAGKLWLVVMLEESPQISISFGGSNFGRQGRNDDLFVDDLHDVRTQMAQVEGRILITISGVSSPLDGSQDTHNASSTATMRRRIKRRKKNGALIVPSLPYAQQIPIAELPATLPQGPRITISAHVKSMSNSSAHLFKVRLEDAKGFDRSIKIPTNKNVRLERVGKFQRVEAGGLLQRAMDSHSRIRLDVIAALTWDSGELAHFELMGFLASERIDSPRTSPEAS